MAAGRRLLPRLLHARTKTTSFQYLSARPRDATFEKLMIHYKHLADSYPIIDLLLAAPSGKLPVTSFSHLYFRHGALRFLRHFPYLFTISHPSSQVSLSGPAAAVAAEESSATSASGEDAAVRLRKILAMSCGGRVPLRAVFRVWRELGLPDDFEESVIAANPNVFRLVDNPAERNTHFLELVEGEQSAALGFVSAVEEWRGCSMDEKVKALPFGFCLQFPPGMRLTKNYRKKVRSWQELKYIGPYKHLTLSTSIRKSKLAMRMEEKRAVGIAHEFLSLTVEKMVEVEKFTQFRKWFGINLNVTDMFVDHPGIFYVSTKGGRKTVFLREAYQRGCLIHPNPIYNARRKYLYFIMLRRRGTNGGILGTEDDMQISNKVVNSQLKP